MNLKRANLENRLETRLKHYAKYKVLIIDEIGYLPIKEFSKWSEVFGDITIASAILDRILHHAKIEKITGRSYRTKDAIKMIKST